MQSHFLLATLALVFLTSTLSAHAKAPHARNVARPRPRAAADLDAAQSSEASLALSIYNNIGTTAFAAATAGVCATGYQTYTAASGTVRCCVGSVVDGICFTDTRDIVYDADPQEVLDGNVDPPTVDSSATATATAVVGTATSTSTTSTINYLTATSFKATATGGTTGAAAATASTSTSYSQLSQTLTPTGSSSSSSSTSGALALDVGMLGLLGSFAAVVAGGIVAML